MQFSQGSEREREVLCSIRCKEIFILWKCNSGNNYFWVIFQRNLFFAASTESHRMWQQAEETAVLCSDTLSACINSTVPRSGPSLFCPCNHLLRGEIKQQHLPTSGGSAATQSLFLWVTGWWLVIFLMAGYIRKRAGRLLKQSRTGFLVNTTITRLRSLRCCAW